MRTPVAIRRVTDSTFKRIGWPIAGLVTVAGIANVVQPGLKAVGMQDDKAYWWSWPIAVGACLCAATIGLVALLWRELVTAETSAEETRHARASAVASTEAAERKLRAAQARVANLEQELRHLETLAAAPPRSLADAPAFLDRLGSEIETVLRQQRLAEQLGRQWRVAAVEPGPDKRLLVSAFVNGSVSALKGELVVVSHGNEPIAEGAIVSTEGSRLLVELAAESFAREGLRARMVQDSEYRATCSLAFAATLTPLFDRVADAELERLQEAFAEALEISTDVLNASQR